MLCYTPTSKNVFSLSKYPFQLLLAFLLPVQTSCETSVTCPPETLAFQWRVIPMHIAFVHHFITLPESFEEKFPWYLTHIKPSLPKELNNPNKTTHKEGRDYCISLFHFHSLYYTRMSCMLSANCWLFSFNPSLSLSLSACKCGRPQHKKFI